MTDKSLKTIGDQTAEALDIAQNEVAGERNVTVLPRLVMILAILSSTFLHTLDNTVMADVRPGIMGKLGRMDMLPWLSVSLPMWEVGANPTLYCWYFPRPLTTAGMNANSECSGNTE
jgi:hypothetical protein